MSYTETVTKTYKNPPEVRKVIALAMKAYRDEKKKQKELLLTAGNPAKSSPAVDSSLPSQIDRSIRQYDI